MLELTNDVCMTADGVVRRSVQLPASLADQRYRDRSHCISARELLTQRISFVLHQMDALIERRRDRVSGSVQSPFEPLSNRDHLAGIVHLMETGSERFLYPGGINANRPHQAEDKLRA